MDFFKDLKFRKAKKPGLENDMEDKPVPQPEDPRNENGNLNGKSDNIDPAVEAEDDDDDDDDFITKEVKRRLKELRRNSFMVLIPEEEESCAEEEEDDEEGEGETRSNEWRDIEAEGRRWWGGFDAVHEKYCERMLFFDRMSTRQLNEVGNFGCCCTPGSTPSTPSPRSASKKLISPFRCLSLKKIEEPEDETEHLQQLQNSPYQDIETAYVAQVCLTWEVLHCQYTQLCQKISTQQEFPACYNNSAQQLQQFQVLLQRFIENEPFEQGQRVEIYARVRNLLPKLLQVPNIKGTNQKEVEVESDSMLLASDLIKILESSILTFQLFFKSDKKKQSGRNLFGNQNQSAIPLHLIQSSFEKRRSKLKELSNRSKGWKKKSWPQTLEDVEVLFGLIDIKLISRVLRMVKITKEQLIWCEEKLKKLDITDGKLVRDPTPILFPC